MTQHMKILENKRLELTADSSFEDVARDWHTSNLRRWSEHHAATVLRRIEKNLFPLLGDQPVEMISTHMLMKVIRLIELREALELANRVIQYAVAIFYHAARQCPDYHRDNPAVALRGSVIQSDTQHHPALDPEQFGEFITRVENSAMRAQERLALNVVLHTFVRNSELRFARWGEIDLSRSLWEIPAKRTPIPGVKYSERGSKMKTPHLVPLSRQTIQLFKKLQSLAEDCQPEDLIFHSVRSRKKPMTDNRINQLMRELGYDTRRNICCHGIRTMACSSLVESGCWSRDAIERQMSHMERNNVRAAYIHKAEHIHERRKMMQWWSDYLDVTRKKNCAPYEFAGWEISD